MIIRLRVWNDSARASERRWRPKGWDRAFFGCLILTGIGALMFAPFAGRTAAPGLQIGPFTNYGGKTYIGLLITNATATNIYQIQPMPALFNNLPFVGSITGAYGQSNFWFEVGPESAMFFRALDCVDCDGDGILDWKDGNPSDTNVSGLTITILSPTNGATVY